MQHAVDQLGTDLQFDTRVPCPRAFTSTGWNIVIGAWLIKSTSNAQVQTGRAPHTSRAGETISNRDDMTA